MKNYEKISRNLVVLILSKEKERIRAHNNRDFELKESDECMSD